MNGYYLGVVYSIIDFITSKHISTEYELRFIGSGSDEEHNQVLDELTLRRRQKVDSIKNGYVVFLRLLTRSNLVQAEDYIKDLLEHLNYHRNTTHLGGHN